MAVIEDTVITRYLADVSQATKEMNKLQSLGANMAKAQTATGGMAKEITQVQSALTGNNQALSLFNSGVDMTNNKLKEMNNRFDMNILSWVFGGMALQRMGLTIIRFLVPSMDKLEKLNTAAAKKVMGLGAAFEFLKISLFETLANTPMFEQFVQFLIKAAIWISEFAQKHPKIVAMAAAFAGVAAALGTLAIGIGILGQLGHLAGLGLAEIKDIGIAIKGLGTALMGLSVPTMLAGAVAAVGLAAIGAALSFEETRGMMASLWDQGFAEPSKKLMGSLLRLIGLEVESGDEMKMLASVGVWVFAIIAGGVNIVIDALTIMIDLLLFIPSVFDGLITGDFSRLKDAWGSLKKDMDSMGSGDIISTVGKGPSGIFKEAFGASEELNMSMMTSDDLMSKATDSQLGLADSMMSTMGTPDDPSTMVGSWNSLGTEMQNNNTYFDTLKTNIDDWQPEEKVVKIRYEYSGGGPSFGEGGGSSSSSKANMSSITG